MKKALVCGAGGFIGGHLVTRLKNEGYWVRGRNSDNTFIEQSIGWKPSTKLIDGIHETYVWIESKVKDKVNA